MATHDGGPVSGRDVTRPRAGAEAGARGAPGRAAAESRPTIVIRPVTAADLPHVAELFGALHAFNATFDKLFELSDEWPTYLEAALTRALDQPESLWVLAWDGAEAVGLLIGETHVDPPLFRRRPWLELSALYVQASHRRYGVARLLVDHLTAWGRARGFDTIQLYVSAGNTGARDFYAREGFTMLQEIWRKQLAPDAAPPPDGAG